MLAPASIRNCAIILPDQCCLLRCDVDERIPIFHEKATHKGMGRKRVQKLLINDICHVAPVDDQLGIVLKRITGVGWFDSQNNDPEISNCPSLYASLRSGGSSMSPTHTAKSMVARRCSSSTVILRTSPSCSPFSNDCSISRSVLTSALLCVPSWLVLLIF